MKSAKEILVMLARELISHVDNIETVNPTSLYYNEYLGDTCFMIAGLLESLLRKKYSEWDESKWIDDSLITNVILRNDKLIIEGVMIWGKIDITEQWIDPFLFEIELLKDEVSFKRFTFLFCDLAHPGITYEDFRDNRDYWAGTNRKWKYVISSSEALI